MNKIFSFSGAYVWLTPCFLIFWCQIPSKKLSELIMGKLFSHSSCKTQPTNKKYNSLIFFVWNPKFKALANRKMNVFEKHELFSSWKQEPGMEMCKQPKELLVLQLYYDNASQICLCMHVKWNCKRVCILLLDNFVSYLSTCNITKEKGITEERNILC